MALRLRRAHNVQKFIDVLFSKSFLLKTVRLSAIPAVLLALVWLGRGNAATINPVDRPHRHFAVTTTTKTFSIQQNLPSGVVGTPYSGQISATGGVPPYSYAVVAGCLPTGLTLDATTGYVSGTPALASTNNFKLAASDSTGLLVKTHGQIAVSSPTTATSTVVTVAVSPTSSTLASGTSQQFSATVQGTSNTSVTWSASAGSISSSGLFTAPVVSTNTNVTVMATSAANSTSQASALVAVTAPAPTVSVSVSPSTASVTSGGTQQFTASVLGTSNTGVVWSASAGSISSSGLFSAPTVSSNTNVTVTATSTADSTKSASVVVAVNAPTPTISVSVSPNTASVASGGIQQFTASVLGTSNTAVTWSASGGSISSSGLFTAPTVTTNTLVSVTATTLASSAVYSSASVTVTAPAPTTTSTNSSSTGTLCGTDSNGVPTNDSQCGAGGTNPYTGEGATDLTSWCGGSVPGVCQPISSCNPTLTAGSFSSHAKYYLAADLNCGAANQALALAKYADINLNGHTVTGYLFWNYGAARGMHIFNGTISCNVGYGPYVYSCIDLENIDGGYTQGGGDKLVFHHLVPANASGISYVIRVDGAITPNTTPWTEFPITAYNNTCVSTTALTSGREHSCFYSESGPVELYNNFTHCISTTNACQGLELYGKAASSNVNGSYVHNNYGLGDPLSSTTSGETSRPILFDGCRNCRAAYNDLWPNNNRGIRLRDAIGAEVDHNYIHSNSYISIHTGDNDVNSGLGINLNQNIHDNTFQLASGSTSTGSAVSGRAVYVFAQQGVTLSNNTYICGTTCTGAQIANLENQSRSFGYPVSVNASTKTITQSSGDFTLGPAITPGAIVSFVGFANSGNNATFTVSAVTPTQIVLADPNNQMVNESSSSATYAGVTSANLYNPAVASTLAPDVALVQSIPKVSLSYCGSVTLITSGNGSLLPVSGTCP